MSKTKIINDKKLPYRGTINHTTTTYFSFKSRIKILFGKPVIVASDIYTSTDVEILGSSANATVPAFIFIKAKKYILESKTGEPVVKAPDEQLKKGDNILLWVRGTGYKGEIAHVNIDESIDVVANIMGDTGYIHKRFNDVWSKADNSKKEVPSDIFWAPYRPGSLINNKNSI